MLSSLLSYPHQVPFFYNHPFAAFVLAILGIWELIWKGLALWRSARNNENAWFIAILIFNTIGILPILYYFVFAKKR